MKQRLGIETYSPVTMRQGVSFNFKPSFIVNTNFLPSYSFNYWTTQTQMNIKLFPYVRLWQNTYTCTKLPKKIL
jgi:hypothetical protein